MVLMGTTIIIWSSEVSKLKMISPKTVIIMNTLYKMA